MKKSVKGLAVGLTALTMVTAVPAGMNMYAETKATEAKTTEAENVSEDFKESKNIWVIGDSIASEHDIDEANEVQITGWGNVLQQMLPEDVTIINKARSGRSSKSYTTEQVYKEVLKGVKEGDYVIIQFGHNDEKEGKKLFTSPEGASTEEGSYKYYLKTKFIEPIYEKGGRVILASSVVRHLFAGNELAEQTHGVYAQAMKELAEECKKEGKEIYFIDTYKVTGDIYKRLGNEETKKLHAILGKGDAAKIDDTHYSPYGAVYMASEIGQQLKELGLSCVQDVQKAWVIEDNAEEISEKRASLNKFDWR